MDLNRCDTEKSKRISKLIVKQGVKQQQQQQQKPKTGAAIRRRLNKKKRKGHQLSQGGNITAFLRSDVHKSIVQLSRRRYNTQQELQHQKLKVIVSTDHHITSPENKQNIRAGPSKKEKDHQIETTTPPNLSPPKKSSQSSMSMRQ